MSPEFGNLGVGDILDAAFALYRRRWKAFLSIALIAHAPIAAVLAILASFGRRFLPGVPSQTDDNGLFNVAAPTFLSGGSSKFAPLAVHGWSQFGDDPGVPIGAAFVAVLFGVVGALTFLSIVYPLCAAALVSNIGAGYRGETIGVRESYVRAWERLYRLLVAQFLATLWIALGFVLCVVPGIVLSLSFSLVPSVVLLEDRGPAGSVGRSRALMKGHLGRGFLLGLAVLLANVVVGVAGSALVHVVPWPGTFLSDFLSSLTWALTLPLSIGAFVLLYYDIRTRKEAYTLGPFVDAPAAHKNSQI